jgi:methionyl-tRNA formyltransferase
MMGGATAGVTLHWIAPEWDSGNIIDVYEFPHFGMTANEVYDECEKQGLILLRKNMARILAGDKGEPQCETTARYYKQGIIDWDSKKRVVAYIGEEEASRVFATHFEGKQYPIVSINGRDFELRAL